MSRKYRRSIDFATFELEDKFIDIAILMGIRKKWRLVDIARSIHRDIHITHQRIHSLASQGYIKVIPRRSLGRSLTPLGLVHLKELLNG